MMAGPVYKMFYLRMKEPWYQLSKEQQDAIFAQMEEAFKKVGGKNMVMCDSSWSSEEWHFWGVEEYPSMEAVQEYTRCLNDLNWFRYVDSEILLGTKMQSESA